MSRNDEEISVMRTDIDRGCTPSPALLGVADADGLGGGRSLGDVHERP